MAQLLIVEGKDGFAISNLLKKRGLPNPKGYTKENFEDFIISAGGYSKTLVALKEALDRPDLGNIGIIVDANDQGATARWKAIKSILIEKGFKYLVENVHPKAEGIIRHTYLRYLDHARQSIQRLPRTLFN